MPCSIATLRGFSARSMPVTRAPRPAIASARMPPPQPTSSTRLPASGARSSIQSRRSGLISCSGRNSPCGSHQREASWLNFSSSAGSAFIVPFTRKKAPPKRGFVCSEESLLVRRRSRLARRRADRAPRAGAGRRRAGRRGRRRPGRCGRLAAADELGVEETIGLQARAQLLVLVALLAEVRALVAGDRGAPTLAFGGSVDRVDVFLRQSIGHRLRAIF